MARIPVVVAVALAIALVAGCNPAQPSPSSADATVAASSSPPATHPPASTAPSTSPSAAPGASAIAAFAKLVAKDGFAYQATFTGRSRHTTTRLPVKGSLAVSGSDYRVAASFTFEDGTATVDHRFVKGKGYVRFDRGKWQTLVGFTAAQSMTPFALVSGAAAVRYVGAEKVGGKTLYRVEIPSVPFHPSLIPASNLTKEVVTRGVMQLLIDGEGRPVSGTATVEGTGRVSGQLQEIIIELDLTFTKVGQKVTVSAP
jgi:hypothetical protein